MEIIGGPCPLGQHKTNGLTISWPGMFVWVKGVLGWCMLFFRGMPKSPNSVGKSLTFTISLYKLLTFAIHCEPVVWPGPSYSIYLDVHPFPHWIWSSTAPYESKASHAWGCLRLCVGVNGVDEQAVQCSSFKVFTYYIYIPRTKWPLFCWKVALFWRVTRGCLSSRYIYIYMHSLHTH